VHGLPQKEEERPKRKKVDEVPLGIRKPKAPEFDPSTFKERQRIEDEEREDDLMRRAEDAPLESPELHQDYEIVDGDEYDRHLEGVTSVNALKELIYRAKEEIEEELEVKVKPFKELRMDELMVFAKEAILGNGEEKGYDDLKRRVHALILEDARRAMEELDRKKDAYMKASGE
jgi:hypothetical protein